MPQPLPTSADRSKRIAEPLFFECADRPMYGVYHPPARQRSGAPVVVHCHTLGVEQLTSCRTEALHARAAAGLGYPAFRYHARGHGDSGGNFADATMESLVEDAVAAAGKARQLSGADRVLWLGVRFGALVAAAAARRVGGAAGFILWEPVVSATDYFRGMLRGVLFSLVAKGKRPDVKVEDLLRKVEQDGRVDVHGYYLHRAILQTSRGRELEPEIAGFAGPVLLVQARERKTLAPPYQALTQALERGGASVTVQQVQEEPAWNFVTNPAWEGAEVVRHTVEWLDALD